MKKIGIFEKQIAALSQEPEQLPREINTIRLQKDIKKDTAKPLNQGAFRRVEPFEKQVFLPEDRNR